MSCVQISASKEYNVYIESGLIDRCGEIIRSTLKADTVALIAGSNVFPLYGKRVINSLESAGFKVVFHVIPAGEEHKTLDTFSDILAFLADNHLTRSDAALALGGGVTGDLTGFAAACYRRGINYIQMPTTLLAAVDSSVGGKTAVDMPQGKNLVGAFHQPSAVICDTDALSTLPEDIYRAGCAEVIKYGLLGNRSFFEELRKTHVTDNTESVITTCVEMKRDIVNEDEFDTGRRALLNMGHTFGHAVEALSNFSISHGYAVAIGMVLITRAAVHKGLCDASVLEDLLDILDFYALPTSTSFSADDILSVTLSDKKIKGRTCDLIVPTAIGSSIIYSVPVEALSEWISLGLGE